MSEENIKYKKSDIDEFAYEFYEMEIKNKLFDLKLENGIYYWQIVRYDIFNEIYRLLSDEDEVIKKKNKNKINYFLLKLKYILKSLECFYKNKKYFYKNKEKKYFFFMASRTLENNKIIDIISKDYISLLKKEFFLFESMLIEGENFSCFNLEIRKKFIFKEKKICNQIKKIEFGKIIKEKFKLDINLDFFIANRIEKFEIEYNYYYKILKKMRVDKAFIVQNGVQSSLFKVLKDLKIDSVELQHGYIGYIHPLYFYNLPVEMAKKKLYIPNHLYTFSSFWNKNIKMPGTKIENMGNTYYSIGNQKSIELDEISDITFISTSKHQKIIEEYLDYYLENNNLTKINLKLHPHQQKDLFIIKNKYLNKNNVKIILNEEKVGDLILRSREVIMVMSTVAYEVLQMGRNLKIIESMDYRGLKELFDLKNVKLISKKEDILEEIPLNTDNKTIFFEEFKEVKFKNKLCVGMKNE